MSHSAISTAAMAVMVWAATPIGAPVEVLPDVLDVARIPSDQARYDVLLEIGIHRQLAAVEGGIADAVLRPRR